LQHTIKKMLAKQPGERYQSVHEIRTNLTKVMEEITSPTPLAEPEKRRGMWIGAVAVLLGLVVVLAFVVFWPSLDDSVPSEPVQIRPLTTDGQMKRGPQLSPDGEDVVYWVERPGNADIFVKSIGEGATPLQLTDDPEREESPAWSPDGKQFAFIRAEAGRKMGTIVTMPAPFGGHERKIATVSEYRPGLSWSPNGKWLAVTERTSPEEPWKIVLVSPETGEKEPLTNPPAGSRGDFYPRFSPDGRHVAFIRSFAWDATDYWIHSMEGGEEQLTFENYFLSAGLSWTMNSREIVYATGVDSAVHRLFRASVDGGKPRVVAGIGMGVGGTSIQGNRLAFVQYDSEMTNIWRIPGPDAEKKGNPEPVIQGNPAFSDEHMSVSPNGEKIAFLSSRTGAYEIWLANADGSEPVQLTRLRRGSANPAWSPDSRRIVFQSNVEGNTDLYITDIDGGKPIRITESTANDERPSWSHDGRWIYFNSNRSGANQLCKISIEGGKATQITEGGGIRPIESKDERYLYFARFKEPGANFYTIWRVATEGGEAIEILEEGSSAIMRNFDVQQNRLYYVKNEPIKGFAICYLNFTTGKDVELFRDERNYWVANLSASADGKWVYYASRPRSETADIWLVENFQ
jgi:Tol biopolymer transport system component